jgi:hypothetical protein
LAIFAVGFSVWLWSLQKALSLGRPKRKPDWRLLPEDQAASADVEAGSRTVRGEPEALSQALARTLAHVHAGGFSPLFEITERTSKRISLTKTGPLVCNQPSGLYFSEGEITFQELGNGTTRVTYVLGFDRLKKRTRNIALAIILGIGLPAMVIAAVVMSLVVIPSPATAVRWQVLQTLQVAHTLWPPFMILGLYSTGRRQSKTYFSNLLTTLESIE